MRRILAQLPIALLTFVMGLLISALTHPAGLRLTNCVIEDQGEVDRTTAESEIAKTVFRYNIHQLFSDVESPVYFLSEAEDRDAREQVVRDLQQEGLPVQRLSQLGMNQRLTFDCHSCPNRQSEFILRVGKIRWLNDKEVLVGGSIRRWYLNADRAYLYRVVKEGNGWAVKDYELL